MPDTHVSQAKENADKHVKHRRHNDLYEMHAGGEPIALGMAAITDGKFKGEPVVLGEVVFKAAGDIQIEQEIIGESFKITYSRPVHHRGAQEDLHPADAALLVRAFLLARIAATRSEVRDALVTLSKHRRRLEKAKKDAFDIGELLSVLDDVENGRSPPALDDATKSAGEESEESVVEDVCSFEAFCRVLGRAKNSFFVDFEHALAELAEWSVQCIRRQTKWLYGVIGLVFLLAFLWIWSPYWGWWPGLRFVFSLLLGLSLPFAALIFTLSALNVKTLQRRIEEKMYERTSEKLAGCMTTLVQTNLNVASLNITPDAGGPHPPEALLSKMDKALELKDRLTSIERVIKAREEHLSNGYKHIAEHRDQVRRTVTAAASGITVGFFTYEVGESIIEYTHVSHNQDPRAMLQWMLALNEEPVTAARSTLSPAPSEYFKKTFHEPHLFGHSLLLTLTLVASVLTAWIAMRKPAEEQKQSHGHH